MINEKSDEIAKEFTSDMIMKYEIAEELGLIDKIKKFGWGELTAEETGRVGGIMTAKKRHEHRGKGK